VFVFICIESVIQTKTAFLTYFCICFAITLASWLIFKTFFKIVSKEELEKMRENYCKKDSYTDVDVDDVYVN
jgi:hypothetical protein